MSTFENFLNWSLNKALFSVVDVETTGISARTNRIIEIGIITFCGNEVLNRYHSFINPGISIPYEITSLTGITDDDVADAPSFEDAAQEIYAHLENSVLLGHNLNFDYQFLQSEFFRAGITDFQRIQICTLKISRRLYPELPSKSLGKVAYHLRIKVEQAHRALDDAEVTLKVFQKQLEELEKFKVKTVNHLFIFQSTPLKSLQKLNVNEKVTSSFHEVPEASGVYIFMDAKGKVMYIGKAKSLRQRLQSHFSNSAPKKSRKILDKAEKLQLYKTNSELTALLLEAEMIKVFSPKSNVQLKRYTSSYFLQISKSEPFPALSVTNKLLYDGNDYFGLYLNRPKAQETFDLIQRTFHTRECTLKELSKKTRCFLAEIDRCCIPCENQDEELYNRELQAIYDFLFGKTQTALDRLLKLMKRYSDNLKFEKAAEVKMLVDLVLKQVHKSSLLAEPVNNANVMLVVKSGSHSVDYLLLMSGKVFIKNYAMDDRNSFEEVIEEYYSGIVQTTLQPEKEDLEKMKIILNWAIKNRNICEFYYLKNYKSKDDLFSKVSVVSKISDEKIINIEVAALLR